MTPRFQFPFDEPHGDSIGDRLIAEARQLDICLRRTVGGEIHATIKLESSLGANFFAEDGDDDVDMAAERRKTFEALADVRKLVAAFADRRQDGAA